SLHLFSQSRGKLSWDGRQFVPGESAQECICIGACAGTESSERTIEEAVAAGGGKTRGAAVRLATTESREGGMIGAAPGAGPDSRGKAFVDYQNDVTAKDIRQAVREGMHSI